MYPVTARYGPAIRLPHTKILSCVHKNLVTGVQTTLDVEDGTVTEDVGANNRWTLSLSVPPVQAAVDTLDTPGGEITVRQGVRYANGQVEWVPLGVHIVDQDELGYAPDGTITVTGYDRSLKVQRNGLAPDQRASVASNKVWQEIQRLVEGAWPGSTYPFPGWALLDTSVTSKVGALVYDDGDRWAAVSQFCTDNSLEMFFDDLGMGVLQPVPVLDDSSVSVWTIDAGDGGVMVDADRTRDMSSTRNVVIVSTSATDVTFPPQVVANTTSGDPLNTTGPLGYVPYEYSSPTLRNSAQARAAGRTMLAVQLGVAKNLTLDAVGHSGLRARDVVLVKLPNISRATTRPELHILDTVAHPLSPSGVQSIATRSTRPDTDGS